MSSNFWKLIKAGGRYRGTIIFRGGGMNVIRNWNQCIIRRELLSNCWHIICVTSCYFGLILSNNWDILTAMQPSSKLVPLVLLFFLVIALTSARFLLFLIFRIADNIWLCTGGEYALLFLVWLDVWSDEIIESFSKATLISFSLLLSYAMFKWCIWYCSSKGYGKY